MKKSICVLCALVMALLPVVGMAAGTDAGEWKDIGFEFPLADKPYEIWKDDVLGGKLVGPLICVVRAYEGVLSEMATAYSAFVGYTEENLYIFSFFNEKTMIIIEINKQGSTRYLLMEAEDMEKIEMVCKEYCGENYWIVSQESVFNGIMDFANSL